MGDFPCGTYSFPVSKTIRALLFKPYHEDVEAAESIVVDGARAAASLAEMLRCKTVSYRDKSLEDPAEFQKFRELLPHLYPNVHEACTLEYIGSTGILLKLKGSGSGAPSVFMSHYDVVQVDETAWEKPPFSGIIEDGYLWGRGTLDIKSTLCAVMESAEQLISGGFVPQADMYFAFAGDEEVIGPSAPAIVDELERRGIKPAFVLDEGGAVVTNSFPGVKQPCALIGIGEKGMMDIDLSVESRGGHASMPPRHTPVGVLAEAVTKIERSSFKLRLTPPIAKMLDTLGRHSTFKIKLVLANLWCFLPVLSIASKVMGGQLNAMLRTTCAFTVMEGSKAYNVIPPKAKVGANLRIVEGDTPDSVINRLNEIIKNDDIKISKIHGINASIASDTEGPAWKKLKNTVVQTWPGTIVSPYLMIACTDSRHYCRITDKVYRFSAMELTPKENATIHGHNERISLANLTKMVEFYTRILKEF